MENSSSTEQNQDEKTQSVPQLKKSADKCCWFNAGDVIGAFDGDNCEFTFVVVDNDFKPRRSTFSLCVLIASNSNDASPFMKRNYGKTVVLWFDVGEDKKISISGITEKFNKFTVRKIA